MDIGILHDVLVIFVLSIFVLLTCFKLRIPTVVGFLITGVLCGPHGLKMVNAVGEVEVLAEIGVVLLLFTIGLEFSVRKLLAIKKQVFLGGLGQVFLTTAVTFLIMALIPSVSLKQGIFYGFLLSLSSTAIVLKTLQDKAQLATRYGKFILGVLIFQDVAIVPMMLMTPFLSGSSELSLAQAAYQMGRALLILTGVLIGARFIIPRLLFQIAKTRQKELFIVCVLAICFLVAWVTSSIGLSLALGAFLAGLIISESEYGHHAVGNILPFQQVFTSFFFVSIGMLLDLDFLIQHPFAVLFVVILSLVIKFLAASFIAILMHHPIRSAVLAGLGLSQVGEFAFILAEVGTEHGLIVGSSYQMFLSVSLLTMGLCPFIMNLSPWLAEVAMELPLPEFFKKGRAITPAKGFKVLKPKDHIVIVGFGICGRQLAWASKLAGVKYSIIETNPETVVKEKQANEPIHFGDAGQKAVLEETNIKEARILVIAISDPIATRGIIEIAKEINPSIYIIVRTRYLREVESLTEIGAHDVIPEEFETSVEIFTRVLRKYLIPQTDIDKFVYEVRFRRYQVMRSDLEIPTQLSDLTQNLSEMEIGVFKLKESSNLNNKKLKDSDIRSKYGLNVLLIRRGEKNYTNPPANLSLKIDDLIVLFGDHTKLGEFSNDEIG